MNRQTIRDAKALRPGRIAQLRIWSEQLTGPPSEHASRLEFELELEMAVDTNYLGEEFSVTTGKALPSIVKSLRHQKGLTQQHLAEALGITQKTMSSLERRSDVASFSRIVELLGLLDAEIVIKPRIK